MFKFLDAFSGIGGFHLSIKQAIPDAQCVLAIENDKHCSSLYYKNFPKTSQLGDIKKINVKNIPSHDLLCAGFPCQPFSVAGRRKGFYDPQGSVFFDIIRILQCHKPPYVILENVPFIKKHDGGKTLDTILKYLHNLNYVPRVLTLNSVDFGLPQDRKRCFIVCGLKRDLNIPLFKLSVVKDILEDTIDPKYYINEPCIFTDIPSKNKTKPYKIGYIKQGRQGERIYSIDHPGITLIAKGGGLAGKTGIYLVGDSIYNKENDMYTGGIRKLTSRECARMQGFQESFILDESDNQNYKMLGNAVSISVVKSIVSQLVE